MSRVKSNVIPLSHCYTEGNEIIFVAVLDTKYCTKHIYSLSLSWFVWKLIPFPIKSKKKELYIALTRWDVQGQFLMETSVLSFSQFYWELWYPYCYICNSWWKRRCVYQAASIIFFVCFRHWELCKGHWRW